tara:strand:- start:382 stop:606 length:225 start_codon:yes stop_codon:yes gene_type:complete
VVGVDEASHLGSDDGNVVLRLTTEPTVSGVTGAAGVGDRSMFTGVDGGGGEVDGVGDSGAVVLGSCTVVDDVVE